MVDINKLRRSKAQTAPIDPIQIFKRLPKPPHINDLWESQSNALTKWDGRRSEKDLVIKLNTGGGKTLVGLLIAQSLLNELKLPVIYLCANKQLVAQTLQKANEVGIAVRDYVSGPDFPADFLNASCILVGSYQALFNGLSKFGVLGSGKEPVQVGGIICDDAHTAFSTLRDVFSISVKRDDMEELYAELSTTFRNDFDEIGRIGSFDDIVERGDAGVLEIPYRAWKAKASVVREKLSKEYSKEFKFKLPLLRDHFDSCHGLVSAGNFTVTPFHPLVGMFPTFADCGRRVYMSATIADDSSIVRTFDANPKSVSRPIVPTSLAGVGERMILIPDLIKFRKTEPIDVVKSIVKTVAKKKGVVILAPSEKSTEQWSDVATFASGEGVARAVDELLTGQSTGPWVFANRYDGMDLIGDACRVLVLYGLPRGVNAYDRFRAQALQGNSSINVALAQRVEQGIGRATRGAGDYCAVFLAGSDLVSWMTRKASLDLMTPSTRTQVQMGHEISKTVSSKQELKDTVDQCLTRDPEWTRYHAETLADRAETPTVQDQAIETAQVEREYVRFFVERDYENAIGVTRRAADTGGHDRRYRGWLLQMAARAAHYWNNEKLTEELQRSSFSANNLLFPPKTKIPYERIDVVDDQAQAILSRISNFALRVGCLASFDQEVSLLTPAATSNQFEEAMKRLGEFLGFQSQRPENTYGVGPDVLWLSGDKIGFVIECKSRKDGKNPLKKIEHGQLLTATEWFTKEYPDHTPVRIVVHPNDLAHKPASADGSYALTPTKLRVLIANLRQVFEGLCRSQADFGSLEKKTTELLDRYHLNSAGIEPQYLVPFKVAEAPRKKR